MNGDGKDNESKGKVEPAAELQELTDLGEARAVYVGHNLFSFPTEYLKEDVKWNHFFFF